MIVAKRHLPLKEGCRSVSRLEYDTAEREYVLISKGGRYVQTGHFWRRYYWWCEVAPII